MCIRDSPIASRSDNSVDIWHGPTSPAMRGGGDGKQGEAARRASKGQLKTLGTRLYKLSLIHISEPTRLDVI
eukprot:3730001-Prorocentrum_lima.AAC.1